jgi:uncharacterized protein YjbI with pentapeptide repeats
LQGANLQGAYLQGANLQGANLQHAYLQHANLQCANLQDAYLQRANLQDANLQCAYLQRACLWGANLQGANLQGAKINNDITAFGILRRVMRSDGHEFFLWHCEDGFYIKAGCRFFTLAESRKHWKLTRGGTPLGDETMDILAMFVKAIKRQQTTPKSPC